MSGDLLTTVDAAELAERQAGLEGEVPLERLERFIGLLASREGEVSARLSFHRDVVGRLLIDGDCWAEVEVVCQRCLKVMSLTDQKIL